MRTLPIWSPQLGDVVLNKAVLEEIMGGSGGLFDTSMPDATGAVISAAAINGGIVSRTGPTAPFTDTTDTAAAIVAALQGSAFQSGDTFEFLLKNVTQYMQTVAGGAGVTMSLVTTVAPFAAVTYLGTIGGTATAPTVVLSHVATTSIRMAPATVNPVVATVSNAAAQTLAAAAIVGGVIARDTQSAARTDTTDTAAAIIAATSGLGFTGLSFVFRYNNNGAFPITMAGGVGVTIPATVVPANSWVEYLVTQTGAATLAAVVVGQGYYPKLGTFVANSTNAVIVNDTRVTATSVLKFGLNAFAGTPVGSPYESAARVVGTSFTVKAGSGDTSTYNYSIEG